MLASCHSLKMLYLFRLALNSSMINSICQQNGKTLQTLKLRWSEGLELEGIKLITSQCTELTEVSLADTYLSEASINIVSSQLTPKVMKLSLGGLWEVQDEHINMLVVRCNRLFELDIDDTEVTNDSLFSIIEYLEQTLWKLDVNRTKIDFSKLLELRSMPGLRILNCQHLSYEDIEKLRIHLPHLCISSSDKAGSKLRRLRQLLSTSNSS